MSQLKIFTTADWGAVKPTGSSFPKRPAEGIVIHNTESANRKVLNGEDEKKAIFELARSIQNDHMHRTPPYSDTGQQFTISRGGLILEGRHGSEQAARKGLVVQGAHAGSNVHNKSWFGIEVEGNNVQAYAVTDPQWKSLVELCSWLSFWGNFDSSQILGHKEVKKANGGTNCPGHLMDHLDELRKAVHTRKLELIQDHGQPA